jgi:phosphopantetheine--protein transferase-like protein
MKQTEEIRGMIATMLMVAPEEIGDGTSLGSAKVRLGLKRLGLALPAGVKPATFAGLIAVLSGESVVVAEPSAPVVKHAATSSGGLQIGLDVEDIHALPVASDYWEHEFYRGTFARSEIAYAVLQADPCTHFAGFWCAKEALRKCDGSFADVSPDCTAVAHEADGRPYLTLVTDAGPERLPHVVSISHTLELATAVVVTGVAAPAIAAVEAIAPAIIAAAKPEAKKSRGLAKLFGI